MIMICILPVRVKEQPKSPKREVVSKLSHGYVVHRLQNSLQQSSFLRHGVIPTNSPASSGYVSFYVNRSLKHLCSTYSFHFIFKGQKPTNDEMHSYSYFLDYLEPSTCLKTTLSKLMLWKKRIVHWTHNHFFWECRMQRHYNLMNVFILWWSRPGGHFAVIFAVTFAGI